MKTLQKVFSIHQTIFILFLAVACTFVEVQSQILTVTQSDYVATSQEDENMIQSYPNPVVTTLNLAVADNFELEEIQVYTLGGELVAELTVNSDQLPTSIHLDLENGTYQFLGIGAFFGKVNWGLAFTVGIGIIVIAGNGTGSGDGG